MVVPATLIPHWRQQKNAHVSRGLLRMYVLASGGSSSNGGDSDRDPPAHELAWNYDIVITTFNRLSTEWSGGGGVSEGWWTTGTRAAGGRRNQVLRQVRGMGGEGHGFWLSSLFSLVWISLVWFS